MLTGDYNQVVGNNKTKFLQECTSALSLNGARDVECYDVRPGSIILELHGSSFALTAAEDAVTADGLKLPSFPVLEAEIIDVTSLEPGGSNTVKPASFPAGLSISQVPVWQWAVIIGGAVLLVVIVVIVIVVLCRSRKRKHNVTKNAVRV